MPTTPQIVISAPDPAWGRDDDTHLHVVLVHPEIPGNTGNIARLCSATGAVLHLVEPLGFVLKDRYLRRAGLDYWPHVTLVVHPSWGSVAELFAPERLHLFTTKTERIYTDSPIRPGDVLVFGRESQGLEDSFHTRYPERLVRIPMRPEARSLNLANACAIGTYEARRQLGWDQD